MPSTLARYSIVVLALAGTAGVLRLAYVPLDKGGSILVTKIDRQGASVAADEYPSSWYEGSTP
jgi:hypothetical protein